MLKAPTFPQEQEQQRLRRLHALNLLDTQSEQVLDAFTDLAASVTGMPIALISLVDQERQWFKSAVGLAQGAQTPREVSFCGHAVAGDELFEVEDASRDQRFFDNPLVTGGPLVVHYAGMPLVMPDGERIGTVCVIDRSPGRLDERQRQFLRKLARSIVSVLLLRESEHHLRRDQQLNYLESLSEFSPVGMFAANDAGAVVHANQPWHRIFGLDEPGDAIGWGWMRRVHPRDQDELAARWHEAIAGRSALAATIRVQPADGSLPWVRLRLERRTARSAQPRSSGPPSTSATRCGWSRRSCAATSCSNRWSRTCRPDWRCTTASCGTW